MSVREDRITSLARELTAALKALPAFQGRNRDVLESAIVKMMDNLSKVLASQSITPTLDTEDSDNVQR